MIISKNDIVAKIRTAIDDVTPTASDSFTDNTDNELWQAAQHAVQALLEELPFDMLDISIDPLTGTADSNRGSMYSKVNSSFLRFVSIDIAGTSGVLNELIEPGSNEAKMQRSPWSRGSSTKPKAMLDHDNTDGARIIVWWPGNTANSEAKLRYIPEATITSSSIDCAVRSEAERMVIYRAAAIFFEGKKEPETAEKFKNI